MGIDTGLETSAGRRLPAALGPGSPEAQKTALNAQRQAQASSPYGQSRPVRTRVPSWRELWIRGRGPRPARGARLHFRSWRASFSLGQRTGIGSVPPVASGMEHAHPAAPGLAPSRVSSVFHRPKQERLCSPAPGSYPLSWTPHLRASFSTCPSLQSSRTTNMPSAACHEGHEGDSPVWFSGRQKGGAWWQGRGRLAGRGQRWSPQVERQA